MLHQMTEQWKAGKIRTILSIAESSHHTNAPPLDLVGRAGLLLICIEHEICLIL